MAVRILIVDDDKLTRTVLETLLRQEPGLGGAELEIAQAGDGQAGLAAFAANPPDVAIVDLLMPRLDGFATCKAMRDTPGGMRASLVMMSGAFHDGAIRNRVQQELGASFFVKPAQLKDLTKHVAGVIATRAADAAQVETSAAKREEVEHRAPSSSSSESGHDLPELGPRSGDFAMRALPAILLDLHESGVTGRLLLRRARVAKTIDLAGGDLVGAQSSARDETLGHFLVGSGVITDEQHRSAVARAAQKREKIGEALLAMGVLTPAKLAEQLAAQARHKLVQALRWPQGMWRFEPQQIPPEDQVARLKMIDVVLTGLRDTFERDVLPDTVARLAGHTLELTDRGHRLIADVRKIWGPTLVAALKPGVRFGDLVDAGHDRPMLHAVLDALVLVDGITTRLPAVGPGAMAIDTSRPQLTPDFSPREPTELFIEKRLGAPVPETAQRLYEMLFEDTTGAATPTPSGDRPLDFEQVPEHIDDAESGVIDLGAASAEVDEATAARKNLLREFLRVQGLDHYGVLHVDRRAGAAEIAASLAERQSKFSRDFYARFELGRDVEKLEEIHAAYTQARATLLDDARRRQYDKDLAGGDLVESAPSLDAELAFRAGEELLARKMYAQAIGKLAAAASAAPDEADYHAALGWAHWLAGGGDAQAADLARPHLSQALTINPDHASAHDYLGRIDAALGTDEALAVFHLERTLDLEPGRAEALDAIEKIFLRRGGARALEKLYRRLLYRAAGRAAASVEASLWLRLGTLYRDHLDDAVQARAAFQSAQRLAPSEAAAASALAELDRKSAHGLGDWEALRARWRRDYGTAATGLEMMKVALAADRHDAAFLAASALVALGHDDPTATKFFERHRPRFVVRAQRPLGLAEWAQLRHVDDSLEIGALMELIAPAVRTVMPLELADLELDESMTVSDVDLPAGFARMRSYVAGVFAVAVPAVFVRPDFGHQIHVGALDQPVLLAGDDALTAPERGELAFRLARAMTYLWPGRAVGGSRPARVMKRIVLACFAEAAPQAAAHLVTDDAETREARDSLATLDEDTRTKARGVVLRLVARSPQFNLSKWSRGLARTADRAGLLVSGDLPAARRFCAESGERDDDLIDFALSPAHLSLRAELGLSIDV
ncbi:MAG TPA: response regulator [Kofleriaceae bacterium]|nr:response regulator [Kofleriaceae bacterium]